MLRKDTKKKIDDARDTLVGVLPLPTDQIELITIALIYKFMDDQDEVLRLSGLEEQFFTGGLKAFSWQQLMGNQLSTGQRITKFINGIGAIQKDERIPNLFREVFQNAFLKFKDEKVLQRFLDIINGFTYNHSEELGNAFEYLLMTMGTQGNNGQFRTPGHIIDFIVEIVDPQKDETILDPACGTGGFLVSAVKHILKRGSIERSALEKNIIGYDNTPLMVRLASVNLYLHHFGNPQIHEYNTLLNDTRWEDRYDCILANPPFMTPRGGIDPHDKFRIPANRTEILFSSYILQHLNRDGKAGFVVPEGIIFQTSGDYVVLRNWLIHEAGLWAVVSLPAQVFQPYSGVKTSILFIDRALARRREEVLLVKVENDGFSLNANRNPIKNNDLPEALKWLELCRADLDEFKRRMGSDEKFTKNIRLVHRAEFSKIGHYKATSTVFSYLKKQRIRRDKARTATELLKGSGVPTAFESEQQLKEWFEEEIKQDIIEYGANPANTGNLTKEILDVIDRERDFNLSFERFDGAAKRSQHFEIIQLGEVCEILDSLRKPIKESKRESGIFPYYGATGVVDHVDGYIFDERLVLIGEDGAKWLAGDKTAFIAEGKFWANNHVHVIRPDRSAIIDAYLVEIINQMDLTEFITGVTVPKLSQEKLRQILIPLPPLQIQQQLVTEINQYRGMIDACHALKSSYVPTFQVQEDWGSARLVDIADFVRGPFGGSLKKEIFVDAPGYLVYEQSHAIQNDFCLGRYYITEERFQEMKRFEVLPGDILMSCSGTFGKVAVVPSEARKGIINQALLKLTSKQALVRPLFLKLLMETPHFQAQLLKGVSGAAIQNVASVEEIKSFEVRLPGLETQDRLIEEYKAEQIVLNGSIALANKLTSKIKDVIDRVWGTDQ